MTKTNLVSVNEYARLCRVTPMAIHQRVKAGTLTWAMKTPQYLVDVKKYPPVLIRKGRRPYKAI